MPLSGYGVYGFGIRPDYDQVSPETFIDMINSGLARQDKYYSEYKRINQYLKEHNEQPDAEDVRILGVEVTGTAATLSTLQEKEYVRGAVLGAVADKY
ncbi:hypothetical protein D3C75_961110 [compost metagenome]